MMIKKRVFVLFAMIVAVFSNAQTIGKYKYHDKDYLVYPLRIDDDNQVPLLGGHLPDGDYIVFRNYVFKRKGRKTLTMELTDTSKVAAFISVKNGLFNGAATIFSYEEKNNGSLKKSPEQITTGNYLEGNKDGMWKTSNVKTGSYTIDGYKNDRLNGYSCYYNKKGTLLYKGKYKDDKATDTAVYYYPNGKIDCTYDLYPDSVRVFSRKNVYGIALKENTRLMVLNAPKTFYKSYDQTGKPLIDLKFNEGIPLPFDSIRPDPERQLKVITLKDEPGKQQYRVIYHNNLGKTMLVTESDYTNLYETRHTRTTVDKKTKRRLYEERESFFLDTLIGPSRPQVLARQVVYGNEIKTAYIPKYRFAYEQNKWSGITSIDSLSWMIYISDTTDLGNDFTSVNTIRCVSSDSSLYRNRAYFPYLKNDFIISEELPDMGLESEHMVTGVRNLQEVHYDYLERLLSKEYYKNKKLFNGRTCLIPAFTVPATSDSITEINDMNGNSYNAFSKGNMVSGKRDGLWEELMFSGDVRQKAKKNLKNYFLSHPGKAEYTTTTYKNGLRNGPCESFSYEKKELLFGPFYMPAYKPRIAAIWPKNLSKNKKIFVYRSVEANFMNDTIDGPYKSYFPNTQVTLDMVFKRGKPHGDYKRYDSDGSLMTYGHFDNGKLDGPFYKYYAGIDMFGMKRAAFLQMKAVFKNNLLVDTLSYYEIDGKPFMALRLNNDTLVFKKQYFNDGRLKEEIIFRPGSRYTLTEKMLESSNYLDIAGSSGDDAFRKIEADYKSYYENGQLLAEGNIALGYPLGEWKFYNINGSLIHQVDFVDSNIALPGNPKKVEISGFYTGYYAGGKLRCKGYLKDIDLSYDCFTKQDKPDLDFYVQEFYDINGKQMIHDGTGYFIKYDENGARLASGKLVNCREDSLWKYYTPEQKLTRIGNYANGREQGVWYEGDLEGINFEDGACFDANNPDAMKAYDRKRKEITIVKILYKNGVPEKQSTFESNLNKTAEEIYYINDY